MYAGKPILDLRPVAAPSHATPGACVYVLLPTLGELVGHAGFGDRNPIVLPPGQKFDPHAFFGHGPGCTETLH